MSASKKTVFVAGGTGATGKCLVQQLLDGGHSVKVVVRSKDRLMDLLAPETKMDGLHITEGSLLDLDDDKLQELVKDCDAVVSCLGHNLTFRGMYGHPRKLVTDAAKKLCEAIRTNKQTCKFILMGSDGVANPNGEDDVRPRSERAVLSLLRWLVPPHYDNECAASYLHEEISDSTVVEWAVVRPTDLVNADQVSEYELHDKPQGGLFGSGTATRINVAHAMLQLIAEDDVWAKWKFKMPFLMDSKKEEPKE